MLVSGIFDSKISGFSSFTEYHESFIVICDKIHELEEKRIVEKLARPISNEIKLTLMNETNRTLLTLQDMMN